MSMRDSRIEGDHHELQWGAARLACIASRLSPDSPACSPGSGELGEVVGGADQGPFGLHFLDASQQKLPEPPCLFDLSEDRLHGLLPEAISASPSCPLQPVPHGSCQRSSDILFGAGGVVFGSPGCYVPVAIITGLAPEH